jgi:hypothetical protein
MYSKSILWPDQGFWQKLEFSGAKGLLLDWFGSYLEERKQGVNLKFPKFKNSSNWFIVRHVVLQGSVLGPLPFNLYINDFRVIINEILNVIMLADDTSVLVTASTEDKLIERFNLF